MIIKIIELPRTCPGSAGGSGSSSSWSRPRGSPSWGYTLRCYYTHCVVIIIIIIGISIITMWEVAPLGGTYKGAKGGYYMYACVYIYIYIYICIRMCIYIYIYRCIYTYTHHIIYHLIICHNYILWYYVILLLDHALVEVPCGEATACESLSLSLSPCISLSLPLSLSLSFSIHLHMYIYIYIYIYIYPSIYLHLCLSPSARKCAACSTILHHVTCHIRAQFTSHHIRPKNGSAHAHGHFLIV